MIHDIAHCNNEECKRKDECYRFQAYLELKKKKDNGLYSFLLVKEPDKCKYFMSL